MRTFEGGVLAGHYGITLKEFENVSVFSNRTQHEDMTIFQDDHALHLFLLGAAAALSRTHHSRCGFYGVRCIYAPSSLPFSSQGPSLFFLTPITIFALLDIMTMRPLAPLQC